MSLPVKKWPAGTAMDQGTIAKEWSKEGFDCNLWVDPPGQSWLHFTHPVDEVVVVQDGKLEFDVDGQRALLGPGDEVFIPAGADHSVWNRGDSTAYWLYGYRRNKVG